VSALRIKRQGVVAAAPEDPMKSYLARLIKLIPSEVVGLYLAGKGGIQSKFHDSAVGKTAGKAVGAADSTATASASILSAQEYWIGWTLFCLVAVVVIRVWATSDKKRGVSPEWVAVLIATVSFVIWVYSLGDVFDQALHIWDPLLASLLVLGWTFLVPLVYKE
jgi:hypothetical protein